MCLVQTTSQAPGFQQSWVFERETENCAVWYLQKVEYDNDLNIWLDKDGRKARRGSPDSKEWWYN